MNDASTSYHEKKRGAPSVNGGTKHLSDLIKNKVKPQGILLSFITGITPSEFAANRGGRYSTSLAANYYQGLLDASRTSHLAGWPLSPAYHNAQGKWDLKKKLGLFERPLQPQRDFL